MFYTFETAEDLKLPVPDLARRDRDGCASRNMVAVEPSPELSEYIQEIGNRVEIILIKYLHSRGYSGPDRCSVSFMDLAQLVMERRRAGGHLNLPLRRTPAVDRLTVWQPCHGSLDGKSPERTQERAVDILVFAVADQFAFQSINFVYATYVSGFLLTPELWSVADTNQTIE